MSFNSTSSSNHDASAWLVGIALLVVFGGVTAYLMLVKFDHSEQHKGILKKAALYALLIEFIVVMAYIVGISGSLKNLLSTRPKCNLFIDASISTVSSKTINNLTYTAYHIHSCNAYVLCQEKSSGQKCSLGNAIDVTEGLAQPRWLRDAVCPHLNSYIGSENAEKVEPSDTFRTKDGGYFLISLYVIALSYYLVSGCHTCFSQQQQSPNKRILTFVISHFARLWLLPINLLSPISHPAAGCDSILTHAALQSWPVLIMLVIIVLFLWLLCCSLPREDDNCMCMWRSKKFIASFLFCLAIVFHIGVTYDASITYFILLITSVNIRAFGLMLGPSTLRSIGFFCIQIISMLRLLGNLLCLHVSLKYPVQPYEHNGANDALQVL